MLQRFDRHRNGDADGRRRDELPTAIWQRQRPQGLPLNGEAIDGPFFERCVDAAVGDLIEPWPYLSIGQCDVDEFGLRGLERIEERFPQVAVESLDFAFGLRSVRCAEFDRKP